MSGDTTGARARLGFFSAIPFSSRTWESAPGSVTVALELSGGTTEVDLDAGDAVVVPQGVWHQVTIREPGQLIHITPGPNGDARPLRTRRRP